MINGKRLIDMGYKPGPWFPAAIAAAQNEHGRGGDEAAIRAAIDRLSPAPIITRALRAAGELPFNLNIIPEDEDEVANAAAVEAHMRELMRLPTVVAGSVMPDAMPAGSQPGTIPVGGVIATENAIHPGMHSSDICCSMAVTFFGAHVNAASLLDAGMELSHFGGGGRPRGEQFRPSDEIMAAFDANPFLRPLSSIAIEHFATQGDGNHFFYVGRSERTGEIALVTHHGSRGPGAKLYKAGMQVAERQTREASPDTPRHNAWIAADSQEGLDYWDALQTIRAWTKSSHFKIHDLVAEAVGAWVDEVGRFWNEHNFVFKRGGLFYHGKGATPAWSDFAEDASGLTLIPLNMAEPILIARGLDNPKALGFAPHGAGRNFSRTQYLKRHEGKTPAEMMAEQTPGLDIRFFSGIPDASELPLAYKNAATVRRQIEEFGLAEIVDEIMPIGSIMAGDWQQDAPWRKKR
ncbi:RtcB family protein [Mesorhizobium sp. M0189]|uniref:RtcB family protein n=1 Tax=Mesorhizobium sp. M0189 TaxID=2956909 RepID=UPI0033356BFB